jgi:hypothetical protein
MYDESDNYEDDDDSAKEVQIGGITHQKTNKQIDFDVDDDDEDEAFDNAFKYDKDEFKSDVSESQEEVK